MIYKWEYYTDRITYFWNALLSVAWFIVPWFEVCVTFITVWHVIRQAPNLTDPKTTFTRLGALSVTEDQKIDLDYTMLRFITFGASEIP